MAPIQRLNVPRVCSISWMLSQWKKEMFSRIRSVPYLPLSFCVRMILRRKYRDTWETPCLNLNGSISTTRGQIGTSLGWLELANRTVLRLHWWTPSSHAKVENLPTERNYTTNGKKARQNIFFQLLPWSYFRYSFIRNSRNMVLCHLPCVFGLNFILGSQPKWGPNWVLLNLVEHDPPDPLVVFSPL